MEAAMMAMAQVPRGEGFHFGKLLTISKGGRTLAMAWKIRGEGSHSEKLLTARREEMLGGRVLRGT